MENDELRHACTKCNRLYKTSPQAERCKASAGHAGLCEKCLKNEQERVINERLALCVATLIVSSSHQRNADARFSFQTRRMVKSQRLALRLYNSSELIGPLVRSPSIRLMPS